jgi:hypothetical protein
MRQKQLHIHSLKRAEVVFTIIFYSLLTLAFLYAIGAFAQSAPGLDPSFPVIAPPKGLEWLVPFLQWVGSLPKIGPFIVGVMKYVGAAAAVFTAISVAVTTVLRVPALIARWAGAVELAGKIEAFHLKIKPWLDYLSIFNAQKK